MTVMVRLMLCFSSSAGATILLFPDSLRNFFALFFKIMGSYDSGMNIISGNVTPAKMSATQNAHLQLTTEMNPLMAGPTIGPRVVA